MSMFKLKFLCAISTRQFFRFTSGKFSPVQTNLQTFPYQGQIIKRDDKYSFKCPECFKVSGVRWGPDIDREHP